MQFQQKPSFPQKQHQYQNHLPQRMEPQRFNQPHRQDYSPMRKQSLNYQPNNVPTRYSQQRFTPTRTIQNIQDYIQFQPRPPQRSSSPIQQPVIFNHVQVPIQQAAPPIQKIQSNDFQQMKKAVTCFMQINMSSFNDFDNMCVSLLTAYLHEESKQKNFTPTCVMEIYESLTLLSKAITKVMDSLREKINSIIKDDYLEDKGAMVSYKLAVSDFKGFQKTTFINTAPQSPKGLQLSPISNKIKNEQRPSQEIETQVKGEGNQNEMKKTSYFNSNNSQNPMDDEPETPQSKASDKLKERESETKMKTKKKDPKRITLSDQFDENLDQ